MVDLFKRQFRKELRNGEYAMHFADSGEHALELMTQGINPEIMLILSDINMPGMSGIELLAKSKTLWPDLPVIVITAYGDDDNKHQADEAGASAFLTKPIDFGELKSMIARMYENQSA